jgi:hypothetical protein
MKLATVMGTIDGGREDEVCEGTAMVWVIGFNGCGVRRLW